ncbi:MAG: class I SAM-dependent methyltransferase [Gemmatimonadaceae bacterium]|nr:class I SAM-dependent methyltransferase [Gemmatimonadaceae bacterium]
MTLATVPTPKSPTLPRAIERLGLAGLVAPEAMASAAQDQTADTFGYKWHRTETFTSQPVQAMSRTWMLDRYCGGDEARLDEWLAEPGRLIVDAGCGAGHSALALFGDRLRAHDYLGIDISTAVRVAAAQFAARGIPAGFLQHDLTTVPLPAGSVDLLFSEGVLHHTDDTRAAFLHLARALAPGGRFLAYVYAKKGPVREFTDDHIRAQLAALDNDAAWRALEPLTRLGIALGELGATVHVPEAVPLLGIPAGPIDVQRLFYWHVCKLFHRPELTLDEMNHINFDWFRPANCHRHTPGEVEAWCAEAGLSVERLHVEEAGITVVARR